MDNECFFSLWFIVTEQRKQINLFFQIVRETTFFNATFVDTKFQALRTVLG